MGLTQKMAQLNPKNEKLHDPKKQWEIVQAKLKRDMKLKMKLSFANKLLIEQAATLIMETWRLQKISIEKSKPLQPEYYRAVTLLSKTLEALGLWKLDKERVTPQEQGALSKVINGAFQ
jgi:hypothetical protein